MKHVYGKRNVVKIFLRRLETRIYKKLSKVLTFGDDAPLENVEKTIFCYPAFSSVEDLVSSLNKFAWAFPEASGVNIRFATVDSINIDEIVFSDYLVNQHLYYKGNININKVALANVKDELKNASLIAVHEKASRYDLKLLPYLKKCTVIDPYYYSLAECNFWKFGYYNLLKKEEKENYHQLSIDNYLAFKKLNANKNKAYIFTTGPSYSRYSEFTYGNDSIKIICNTITKDTEFLEFIGGPDIVCFADPVFHFSSCTYAHEFRELIINTVRKYNCYAAVPASTVPLLIDNYPELRNRIIGMRWAKTITFPNETSLAVKPSGSIISFIMLPIATSLADEIYILGADGRGKQENYFWKHNEKVQLEHLKESAFLTHPSFFRDRDYSDQYQVHCNYVEEIVQRGEAMGKKYCSLTESFIPAFNTRPCKIKQAT